MMVIPALVILLILLTVMFRKFRVCFKATTSDTDISPPNDEINEENIGREEPRTMVGSQFDVFLSFRGETRKGFTDHLHQGLKLRGISTFIDSENLEKGEKTGELLGYIEKSKICIPIFSKGYADSRWCLRELAKVVECKQKVIPVFLDVDPSDVKKQSGPFALAFKKHESQGQLKPKEVRKWREALTEVGNITGFTLKGTDGYEAKLVQIIVKKILDEVNPHHLHVGKYIIGHESHLAELMRILDLKSNDVRMIGIHGMGGIGKTTLVKALYNKIYLEFEAYSFLFNVRATSLVSLQQQMLKDIFQSDETIRDESMGTQLIKKKIGTKKVLIILDDVDKRVQLSALVDSRDWFRKGSRIIITTRDTKPLTNLGVKDDEIYELSGLSDDDSMKLFCYHAFRSEKPSISNECAKMCSEVVSSINGLPLALEVFGSQFFDLKTEKEWRALLARLKESQHQEIHERLKLSYDSLDDKEKKVFLDIACFFVGNRMRREWVVTRSDIPFEVDDVMHFWQECGFHPEHVINVLKHKSLIKISKWKRDYGSLEEEVGWCFEMHDQIRDMGWKVVEDEEGKSCSRLWDNHKVIKTLPKQRVPTAIEGIMFQGEEEASNFSFPCLQEMDQLRLFNVHGAKFEGSLHFPEDLKWLALPNCQHSAKLPSVSIPGDVVVLNLHGNDNVANVLLGKCISRSMEFNKLKVLDLSCTRITTTPDFSVMPCLVKLTFERCTELVDVHESVVRINSLVWLNLSYCAKLKKLPDNIFQLTSLELLSLYMCQNLLYLPKKLGNMKSLKHLDLRTESNHIINLPDSMRNLDKLEHLFIREITIGPFSKDLVAASKLKCCSAYVLDVLPDPCCQRKIQLELIEDTVEELTDTFRRWENIELLILNCKSLKSLPSCLSSFSRLKTLNVSGCKQLHTIPQLSSSVLQRLDASNCTNLRALPDLSNFKSLEELSLGGCNSLECIPGFETIAKNIWYLKLPGPSGGIQCSNLSNDFKNKVFMQAPFGRLWRFKMGGNIIAGPHSGRQSLSFFFPDVRFNHHNKCYPLKLILDGMISSSVDMAVIMEDDHVLFQRRLTEDDFYNDGKGSETFSFEGRDAEEIVEHLQKGSGTILISTDVSKLSRVELEATYRHEVNLHHVGEYIVGHESQLAELMRILDVKSNDVWMIGIHGMGGIGKTTLVKALYNKISSKFEAYSFLFNVRETSRHLEGIVSLQQQLLKDVFRSDGQYSITDESKGIQLIKEKIGTKKVLIILDDVDSRDQLRALVGSRDWFREGSRIVITTRDTKPLTNFGVKRDEFYELPGLNHDNSMKLFCYHAFGSEKPSISNEYAKMCSEAVSSIHGLPLALEIFGSQFFDLKTEKEWRVLLARLKESQYQGIHERLKFSYDSLNDKEKKVFLDIACFFVGKRMRRKSMVKRGDIPFKVDDVMQFWEGCGFHPHPVINVLKHKSLIKINKWKKNYGSSEAKVGEWCFEMHDRIRDMGWIIVEDEQKEGKSCSRLWNNPKVIKTLRKQRMKPKSCLTNFEGIMFQEEEEEASDFTFPCLQEMDRLRLFHVHGAKFEGFPHFPKDLKWLGLPCCQFFQMPTSVAIPKEVTVLDLHDNDDVANVLLEKCISRSMEFNKLKVLDLSCTRITMTPDFSVMPCLVNLTFERCRKLVVVNESVGQLKSLIGLNLSRCWKLEKLPDTICKLTSLEFLSLHDCCILLYLPKQLGNMASLEHLDFSNCTNLRALPDFSTLQSLRELFLGGCNLLQCIPGFETIAENIEDLDLRGIQYSNLSNDFKNKMFMQAHFRNLRTFKMGVNLIAVTHSGQQSLSIFFPDVRFNKWNSCSSLKLILDGMISSPVDIAVVMEDDHVLFETRLAEDDFDNDDESSKTFSFKRQNDEEMLEHLRKGSGAILVSTDVSRLSRVELQANYE